MTPAFFSALNNNNKKIKLIYQDKLSFFKTEMSQKYYKITQITVKFVLFLQKKTLMCACSFCLDYNIPKDLLTDRCTVLTEGCCLDR